MARDRPSDELPGLVHGPGAATEGLRAALARTPDPSAMVLVEGVSDQLAVEVLAFRLGRDLAAERVAVVPVGGAGAVRRVLEAHASAVARIVVLCDVGEEPQVRRSITAAGVDVMLAACDVDLEDELIRAVGIDGVLAVVDGRGDGGSFARFQQQPAWRGRPIDAQLRRFFGAGARRKLVYARSLTEAAIDLGQVPPPLRDILAAVDRGR